MCLCVEGKGDKDYNKYFHEQSRVSRGGCASRVSLNLQQKMKL